MTYMSIYLTGDHPSFAKALWAGISEMEKIEECSDGIHEKIEESVSRASHTNKIFFVLIQYVSFGRAAQAENARPL